MNKRKEENKASQVRKLVFWQKYCTLPHTQEYEQICVVPAVQIIIYKKGNVQLTDICPRLAGFCIKSRISCSDMVGGNMGILTLVVDTAANLI